MSLHGNYINKTILNPFPAGTIHRVNAHGTGLFPIFSHGYVHEKSAMDYSISQVHGISLISCPRGGNFPRRN